VKSFEQNNVKGIRLGSDPFIVQDIIMEDQLAPDAFSDLQPSFIDNMEAYDENPDVTIQIEEKTNMQQSAPQCSVVREGLEETILGAAQTYGQGLNIFDYITYCDENAPNRESNPYYPFSCFTDWEVARWLSRLNIPMYAMDEFFKLKYVCIFMF
jgi:hypothetical protein